MFSSLHSALLAPFIGVVVLVAASISALSYQTGLKAIDHMSERLLLDISNRVVQATAQHLATSTVALNAISPSPPIGIEAPVLASLVPKTLADFERRMWIATNLFDKGGAYVYYGAANGEFVGLHRDKTGRFEIRVRESDASGRTIYEATGPDARGRTLRVDNYDPRARLWYAMASNRGAIGWSPVYVDFTTQALTVSLAKPIYATGASDNTAGNLRGVVATDVPLTALNEFVSGLQVSRTGVAFIVERDGSLVATSTPEPLVTNSSQQQTRLHAEKSANPLVRQAYQQWRDNMLPSVKRVRDVDVALYNFDGDTGRVQMSATAPSAAVGLDWTMLVAIPRTDHMGDVRRTVLANVVIGLLAVALAIGTGLWIMHRVTGDVRRLSDATRLLARGQSPGRLFAGRHDELGVIAKAMEDFKNGLLIDPLTGALTRATFEKRFATYIGHQPDPRLAIVFVDLDRFKRVNDEHGHTAGDAVLAICAQRIASVMRKDDLIGRFGGDEFVLMLPGVASNATLEAQMNRVNAALQQPISLSGMNVHVGGSCGGALYSRDGDTFDALLEVADARMYAAKRERANMNLQAQEVVALPATV